MRLELNLGGAKARKKKRSDDKVTGTKTKVDKAMEAFETAAADTVTLDGNSALPKNVTLPLQDGTENAPEWMTKPSLPAAYADTVERSLDNDLMQVVVFIRPLRPLESGTLPYHGSAPVFNPLNATDHVQELGRRIDALMPLLSLVGAETREPVVTAMRDVWDSMWEFNMVISGKAIEGPDFSKATPDVEDTDTGSNFVADPDGGNDSYVSRSLLDTILNEVDVEVETVMNDEYGSGKAAIESIRQRLDEAASRNSVEVELDAEADEEEFSMPYTKNGDEYLFHNTVLGLPKGSNGTTQINGRVLMTNDFLDDTHIEEAFQTIDSQIPSDHHGIIICTGVYPQFLGDLWKKYHGRIIIGIADDVSDMIALASVIGGQVLEEGLLAGSSDIFGTFTSLGINAEGMTVYLEDTGVVADEDDAELSDADDVTESESEGAGEGLPGERDSADAEDEDTEE